MMMLGLLTALLSLLAAVILLWPRTAAGDRLDQSSRYVFNTVHTAKLNGCPSENNAAIRSTKVRYVMVLLIALMSLAMSSWLGIADHLKQAAQRPVPVDPTIPDSARARDPAPATASRTPPDSNGINMDVLAQRVRRHLELHPDDVVAWTMLARSTYLAGQYQSAAAAYRRATQLQPGNAQLLIDEADAVAMSRKGELEGEPRRLVEGALKIDPANRKALALAATAASNRHDYASAIQYWEKLLIAAGPNAPDREYIRSAIEAARSSSKTP